MEDAFHSSKFQRPGRAASLITKIRVVDRRSIKPREPKLMPIMTVLGGAACKREPVAGQMSRTSRTAQGSSCFRSMQQRETLVLLHQIGVSLTRKPYRRHQILNLQPCIPALSQSPSRTSIKRGCSLQLDLSSRQWKAV